MTLKRYGIARQQGMTLLEITVVLLILTTLAGLALPYVRGNRDMAACQITDASLHAAKEAIMGGNTYSGYYIDTLGKYPQDLDGLGSAPAPEYSLYYLFSDKNLQTTRRHQLFNAHSGIGWHGPYLATGTQVNAARLNKFDARFGAVFDVTQAATDAYVHFDIKLHDGPDLDTIKTPEEAALVPHLLDAWGRPIVLQIPYDMHSGEFNYDYARLVSAGPTFSHAVIDTKIQYDSSFIDSNGVAHPLPDALDRNNDRVLYLKNPDPLPEGNQACNGDQT